MKDSRNKYLVQESGSSAVLPSNLYIHMEMCLCMQCIVFTVDLQVRINGEVRGSSLVLQTVREQS